MTLSPRLFAAVSVTAVAALAWTTPQTAEACGGTFCDNLPQPMPIDQTGENILFIVDGPAVEVHIQINIDSNTDAEKFAWVIPVATMPEFQIGSDPLFNSLLAASVPQYFVQNDCGGFGDDSGVAFISSPDGGGAPLDEVYNEVVGAFDVTVLADDSAADIAAWLVANDFAEDETAMPILEEYVAQGWMFVAVRLANNVGVDQVHPLVMTYDNGEPCVPLRLTRIAASEDMEVRTFFLGESRVAPSNYKHVLVNPLKIDWLESGANYKEVVTMAVDQDGAGGKAFVTEFAGSSDVVARNGLWSENWNPDPFVAIAPEDALGLLSDQGLVSCFVDACQFNHPLILGLLRQYLPAPDDTLESEFWTDMPDHAELIDLGAWDGAAFAADLGERIVDPGFHAVELLDTWSYVTRLYTTISPAEMTVDPIFHPHPELPDVAALRLASVTSDCDGGASVVTLPDGREVFIPEGGQWPTFTDEMPWEEDIEEIMEGAGAPFPVVDNTELIDALLADYNADATPPAGGTGGTGPTGSGDTTGGTGGGAAFPGDSGDTDPGGDAVDGTSSGCACQTGRGTGGTIGFGLGLLLAGMVTRRRRPKKVAR
ncbi:MAG: DUF2330 domain-containing protein [Nannocystaceae bacterium]|nr:DUF2330 domain-containing protein [Nannocystaceae bacterium]